MALSAVNWLSEMEVMVGERLVPSYEAFDAMRAICQLFLRNRSRTRIEKSSTVWSSICAKLSEKGKTTQSVEHLCVDDRALLLDASIEMLLNWPDAFIDFANKAGISKAHFNGAYGVHPGWMSEIVNTELVKQNRQVTPTVLEAKVEQFRRELGRDPTKTELRRSLGWQGEKGLDVYFSKK
jgi:hypothetical protein